MKDKNFDFEKIDVEAMKIDTESIKNVANQLHENHKLRMQFIEDTEKMILNFIKQCEEKEQKRLDEMVEKVLKAVETKKRIF